MLRWLSQVDSQTASFSLVPIYFHDGASMVPDRVPRSFSQRGIVALRNVLGALRFSG